jgi:uncharacterized coiled-coil protein SlyX
VEDTKFIRKERQHLDALQERLDWLRTDGHEAHANGVPGFIAGEANALAWALSVLTEQTTSVDVRFERLERAQRVLYSRLGRLEESLREEE